MGFAAAAAQEFDVPASTTQTRCRWSMRGKRSDAPARDGRGRKTGHLLLGNRPPASERQSRDARCLGRELQAAGCRQAKACDLTNNGSEALLSQSLFHDGQHIALMKGFGIDDTIRVQSRIHEAGSE